MTTVELLCPACRALRAALEAAGGEAAPLPADLPPHLPACPAREPRVIRGPNGEELIAVATWYDPELPKPTETPDDGVLRLKS